MYKTDKLLMVTKKIVTSIIILGICIVGGANATSVYAEYDVEASMYGFSVDLDQCKPTVWHNTITTNVKIDGHIVGVCTTNIGMTRVKTKTSSGHYMDQVLVQCKMKGKNSAKNYVGYSEHLTIQSTLPSGTELMAYTPEQLASEVSYTVGANASSDKKFGVSGSVTITEKALEINSYSDTNARLYKTCYDYIHGNVLTWELDKYSYNESKQLANWVIKTNASNYSTKVVIKAKFQRYSAEPGFFASQYNSYSTEEEAITIKMPY